MLDRLLSSFFRSLSSVFRKVVINIDYASSHPSVVDPDRRIIIFLKWLCASVDVFIGAVYRPTVVMFYVG